MEIKLGLAVVLFCSFANCNRVTDYVNLIKRETAKAFTYSLPRDSSAFKTNNWQKPAGYGMVDYIVVGAGAAGAVIASRLSEIESNGVLLLEAGGHETNFTDIPGINAYLDGLDYNWNYNTTRQTGACQGMINKECTCPRGKGLGGSSVINGLLYARGNRKDYDDWAAQGNPGWSFDDVLPFFKISENSQIEGDDEYHGTGGYLDIEHPLPTSPQLDVFIKGNLELGRKLIDYNGAEQMGVGKIQFTTRGGKRGSTGRAFLDPAMHRKNLEISTNSLATKIVIDKDTKKAMGVMFNRGGYSYIAYARKEVIISAGTINSPQLLMLSGIGPKEELSKFKIPLVKELPVGENLQDHSAYYGLIFSTNHIEPARTMEQNVEDYLAGSGPLTISGNSQGIVFYQTKLETRPGYPDVESIIVPSPNTNNDLVIPTAHYTDETFNSLYPKIKPERSITISVILLHPKSRGNLRLKSGSPYDYPLINPNYLSDAGGVDIETMYLGIEKVLELINTKAFKSINATLIYAPHPACKKHVYLSKDFWYCQLRQLTYHSYHPVGTCKMGPESNKGVVDHELKVHGIKNLRVADASIMPEETSGHTYASSIMIGEKAAHMIMNPK